MTRCISAVLLQHAIEHVIHLGRLYIDGVVSIPVHYWIELGAQEIVDIRAQMWLGNGEMVPHGIFTSSTGVTYQSAQNIEPERFAMGEPVFSILAGIPLAEFKMGDPACITADLL